MTPKVLLLGATGYLGGSILTSLKKSHPEVTFTTLVRTSSSIYPDPVAAILKQGNVETKSNSVSSRSASQIDKVRAAGGEPVFGSLNDHELIAKLSSEADVVINAADHHNHDLLNALLEGQRKRKAAGRGIGSLIQTSGCNIFLDNSQSGKFDPLRKVWTDSEEDIRSLSTPMFLATVDIPLLKASEAGDVHSFIICPSGIYGTGSRPDKRDSLFARMLALDLVQQKRAFYVGDGSSKYELVHVTDLVDLFGLVFNLALDALTTPPSTSPYERYYIASPISVAWKEIMSVFSRELYKKGYVKSPEPSSVSFEDGGPFAFMFASNMKTKGLRAVDLGWKPKYTTFSEEELAQQVEVALKNLP